MRKVAAALGFEVMSLYNHVANKDDLLTAMVDHVVAAIEPVEGPDWRTALHRASRSAHHELAAHSWATGLWSSTQPGPARLALMEGILRALAEAGLPDEVVYHGYHAVTMHIVGFTLQEADFPYSQEELTAMAPTFIENMPDDLPHLANHVLAHTHDHGDEFSFLLDLILDGLDGLRT